MCKFMNPATGKVCDQPSVTKWDFCHTHKNTLQSRMARRTTSMSSPIPDAIPPTPKKPARAPVTPTNSPVEAVSPMSTRSKKVGTSDKKSVPVSHDLTLVKKPPVSRSSQSSRKDSSRKKNKHDSDEDDEEDMPKKKVRRVALVLTKNEWGRFEDKKTHIIFDPTTKHAYARQIHDEYGSVKNLGSKDIRICEKNGWRYVATDALEESEEEVKKRPSSKKRPSRRTISSSSEEEEESEEEDDDSSMIDDDDDDSEGIDVDGDDSEEDDEEDDEEENDLEDIEEEDEEEDEVEDE